MEAIKNLSRDEISKMEIHHFIDEGLQDMYQNNLLDFDSTFDELEERYVANE